MWTLVHQFRSFVDIYINIWYIYLYLNKLWRKARDLSRMQMCGYAAGCNCKFMTDGIHTHALTYIHTYLYTFYYIYKYILYIIYNLII